jgi:hypothetical protein
MQKGTSREQEKSLLIPGFNAKFAVFGRNLEISAALSQTSPVFSLLAGKNNAEFSPDPAS